MRRLTAVFVLLSGCAGAESTDSGAFPTSFGGADETTTVDPSVGPTTATSGESGGSSSDDPSMSTDPDDSGTSQGTTEPTEATSDDPTGTSSAAEDPTDEPAVCGDDAAEGIEICDGPDLGGTTCTDLGFAGGSLGCAVDCADFDVSGCLTALCGNGLLEDDETCDGADLDGESCVSQGFDGGALACSASCTFDTTDCAGGDGMLVTVRTTDGMVRALDPETLAITDIGALGVGYDFGEVAWDSSSGTLWMIDGRAAEAMYTVNVDTGAATFVGVHGIEDLFGLAHDPNTNTLFGSGESPTGLYSMNTGNGAAAFVGNPNIAADGLAYDTLRGELVGLAGGGGTMFSMTNQGTPTVLSEQGFINNCGLAYDPVRDLLWAIDWSGSVYTYDPNDGYTRTLQLSGLEPHDGFTFVPGLSP